MNSDDSRLVEVAFIENVHGLDGELKVRVRENAEAYFSEGTLLYLKNRRGDKIPARILGLRVEEKRNARLFFVKFDRIASRSQAETFRDTPVYAEGDEPGPKHEEGPERVIGFEVADEHGDVGSVRGVMETPAHPILEIELTGTESGRTLLVPWVDEYVEELDGASGKIVCRNLHQLESP